MLVAVLDLEITRCCFVSLGAFGEIRPLKAYGYDIGANPFPINHVQLSREPHTI